MIRRRELLSWGAGSALWPALPARAGGGARQAAGTDYRALVCVFLFGGNDGNNLLVPTDATPYAAYQRSRPNLALPREQLLPLSLSNTGGAGYGLHPALPGVQGLVNGGQAALLANVGPLLVPTTKAQYDARSVPLPVNLFSHSDQQNAWQSSVADAPGRSGWAGRMLQRLVAEDSPNSGYAAISLTGSNLWELSDAGRGPYRVPPSGQFGFDFYQPGNSTDPLSAAITSLLAESQTDPFAQTWLSVMGRSIDNQRVLTGALEGSTLTTPFPDTDLGAQLQMAARLIGVRGGLGLTRQCFFCSIGGFDTHGDDQLAMQNQLFGEIDAAVTAFHAATLELGVAEQVTLFTGSDFGRTLASNGLGSDHAWGSHHLVVGGSVAGGRLLGRMPVLQVGGPDDIGGGVWVPSVATEQIGTDLARWYGASDSQLTEIFPRRGYFDALGLMTTA